MTMTTATTATTATPTKPTVSGNANQAVANDDFEAYQREANKADIETRFGKDAAEKFSKGPVEVVDPDFVQPATPKPKVEPDAAPKAAPKHKLGYGELRARVRELETQLAASKTAPRVEPEPEPESIVEPEAAKPPEQLRVRPKAGDKNDKGEPKYKDWEAYEDDLLAWNEEKLLRTIDERSAKKTQEARIEAVNKTIEQSWRERVDASRELHADYDEIALGNDGPGKLIGPGSIVDEWLLQSEYGAELLYYFGQHPAELKAFENQPSPAAARRALVKLEDKLTATAPKPKSEPTAPADAAPEPRVTRTPKPASEIGGRGHSLPDPVAAAIADGSDAATRRYIDEQNRRDIRAKFGDRGR